MNCTELCYIMLLRFQTLKFLSVQLIKNFMVAVSGFKSISPVSSYRLLAHVRARECFLLLRHIDFVMRCMKLEALSLSSPTTRDRMMAQASDRPTDRPNERMNERTKEQSRYIDWAKLGSAIRSSFMLDFLCVTISCQMWPHDSRNDNNLIYMTSSLPLIKQVDPGCDKDVARCDQNVARCDQVVARCQYMLPGQINALRDVIRCCQVWPGVTRLWPEPYFYYKNLN